MKPLDGSYFLERLDGFGGKCMLRLHSLNGRLLIRDLYTKQFYILTAGDRVCCLRQWPDYDGIALDTQDYILFYKTTGLLTLAVFSEDL